MHWRAKKGVGTLHGTACHPCFLEIYKSDGLQARQFPVLWAASLSAPWGDFMVMGQTD